MSAHASRLSGFFHQLDLSQPIISSFEPWAQSMIALSINACMIYFDGASDDKWLACVCVSARVCVHICSHVHFAQIINGFLWVYISVRSHKTMSLCVFPLQKVPVCVYADSVRACVHHVRG